MNNIEAEIRKFIVDRFLFGEDKAFDGDASLLEAGIVDSTGVLELIAHIERKYGIKVENDEFIPENLDTINRLCAFLDRKNVR